MNDINFRSRMFHKLLDERMQSTLNDLVVVPQSVVIS